MRALETDRIVYPLIVSGARSHMCTAIDPDMARQYSTFDPDADPYPFGEAVPNNCVRPWPCGLALRRTELFLPTAHQIVCQYPPQRVCLYLAQQGTVVDSVGHVPCDSSREWKNARILL